MEWAEGRIHLSIYSSINQIKHICVDADVHCGSLFFYKLSFHHRLSAIMSVPSRDGGPCELLKTPPPSRPPSSCPRNVLEVRERKGGRNKDAKWPRVFSVIQPRLALSATRVTPEPVTMNPTLLIKPHHHNHHLLLRCRLLLPSPRVILNHSLRGFAGGCCWKNRVSE